MANSKKHDVSTIIIADVIDKVKESQQYFQGKTIILNCDNIQEAELFTFFSNNFHFLGINKLIVNYYNTSFHAGLTLPVFTNTISPKLKYSLEISLETEQKNS